MKPIVVNGKFLTAGQEGGVHRVAAELTAQLVGHADSAGVPIRVVAPGPPSRSADETGVEIVPGMFGGGQPWEMVTLPWIARGSVLVSFCNLGPVAHRRSIVMIHDIQTRLHPSDYPGRQRLGYEVIQRVLGLTALRILTVSDKSKASIVEHGVAKADRIDVVPNGCDHITSVAADRRVLVRHGLDAGAYILALGSLQDYKNLDVLFRALPRPVQGRWRLVVSGRAGADDYRRRGWQPPDHTVFTGQVSDEELRALYEGAAAVAVPSRTEGFGLASLEAMACGAPVVAARAGALPEVCGDAAMLVDPSDESQWAEGLAAVCTDEAVRHELIDRGRRRAEKYTWERTGVELWRSVRQVALPEARPAAPHGASKSAGASDGSATKIAVVVASLGRPQSLGHLLRRLAAQTHPPEHVVLSVTSDADLPSLSPVTPFAIDTIVESPRGLTIQRNRALEMLKPVIDVVVFYDDDFVPSRFALADIARFFADNPGIDGADGLVLADGATGPGISIAAADRIVDAADRDRGRASYSPAKRADALYGCNMVYRYRAIADVRFDEELPLYGWFEDLDFGARVPGPLAHCQAFRGVHRGEKKGREQGRRLGYSQVANPIYMVRKGTLPVGYCAQAIARRVAMNHLRALWPEPWIDRRGRASGNWNALVDLLRGRLHPQRIMEL